MAERKKEEITELQVEIDGAIEPGAYSNWVMINHTDNEFVLDFAFMLPGTARAKVRSRIISSPRHAKRLLRALESNIDRYEKRFGLIDEPMARQVDPKYVS